MMPYPNSLGSDAPGGLGFVTQARPRAYHASPTPFYLYGLVSFFRAARRRGPGGWQATQWLPDGAATDGGFAAGEGTDARGERLGEPVGSEPLPQG